MLPERKTAAAADVQYAVRDKWGVQWWDRRGGERILAITNKNERCNERIDTSRVAVVTEARIQRPLRHRPQIMEQKYNYRVVRVHSVYKTNNNMTTKRNLYNIIHYIYNYRTLYRLYHRLKCCEK